MMWFAFSATSSTTGYLVRTIRVLHTALHRPSNQFGQAQHVEITPILKDVQCNPQGQLSMCNWRSSITPSNHFMTLKCQNLAEDIADLQSYLRILRPKSKAME